MSHISSKLMVCELLPKHLTVYYSSNCKFDVYDMNCMNYGNFHAGRNCPMGSDDDRRRFCFPSCHLNLQQNTRICPRTAPSRLTTSLALLPHRTHKAPTLSHNEATPHHALCPAPVQQHDRKSHKVRPKGRPTPQSQRTRLAPNLRQIRDRSAPDPCPPQLQSSPAT